MKSGFVPSIQFRIDEARGRVGHCPSHPHTLVKKCCSISGEQRRQVMIHSCSTIHQQMKKDCCTFRIRRITCVVVGTFYILFLIRCTTHMKYSALCKLHSRGWASSSPRILLLAFQLLLAREEMLCQRVRSCLGVRISPVRVAQDILDDISPLRILYFYYYYLTNNLSFTLFVISHTLSPGACTYYYYYYSLQST